MVIYLTTKQIQIIEYKNKLNQMYCSYFKYSFNMSQSWLFNICSEPHKLL